VEAGVREDLINSVYIHIPFCEHFCPYCHFVKVPSSRFDLDSYVEALIKEIDSRLLAVSRPLQTLYVGGGTPSLLEEKHIALLVGAISRKRPFSEKIEFTVEANPGHIKTDRLMMWRKYGVNRLSIGIQSFHDDELSLLGRDHNSSQAETAVKKAALAGFRRLSIDILLALRGQTWTQLRKSLAKAVSLPIEHLSLYILEKPHLSEPDDEITSELYQKSMHFLNKLGLRQYEISNFARPGGQGRHNRVYWRNGSYYGFGAAASGFDGTCEVRNTASLNKYMRNVQLLGQAIDRQEYPDLAVRRLVTGLRLRAGLPQSAFAQSIAVLTRLLSDGVLERRLGRIRIHQDYILQTNSLLSQFI